MKIRYVVNALFALREVFMSYAEKLSGALQLPNYVVFSTSQLPIGVLKKSASS